MTARLVEPIGASRHEQEGNVTGLRPGGELRGNTPAVHLRQHDVQQDEIRPLGTSQRKRRFTVAGLESLEAGRLQVQAADESNRGLVVDDQDSSATRVAGTRAATGATRAPGRLAAPPALSEPARSRAEERFSPALAKRRTRASRPLRLSEMGDPRAAQEL